MSKHIIFLDTSVFETENFFSGRKINHLAELSKNGQIELKITDIVYNEILHRIKENTIKANSAFKKAHALINGEGKIYKNLEKIEIPKVEIETVYNKLKDQFIFFLKENHIEIINSKIGDINDVFRRYFDSSPPFSEGLKKHEFPDAFTLSTIKEWVLANKSEVYFLSNDSDFEGVKESGIDFSQKLSTIIDLIERELNEKYTARIEEIYEDAKFDIQYSLENNFINELSDAVFNKLEQDPFYEDVEVEIPENIEVEIVIGVINEVMPNYFSYEIESNIIFSINVEFIDYSSGFYDKEDNVWYGEERINERQRFSANVISIAEFSYDPSKDKGNFYLMSNFELRLIDEF